MYDFLTQPLSHNVAARTSRDIARDACYMTGFKRRMPTSEKALYIAGAIGFVAALAACFFS